jgi:phage gpG-like protein
MIKFKVKSNFSKVVNKYKSLNIPKIMATESVKFSKEAFSKGGFTDKSFVRWKVNSQGTQTLVDTGSLMNSIKIISIGKRSAIIGSTLDYARIQNEGGSITITDKMRGYFWAQYKRTGRDFWKWCALSKDRIQIPKRQFIGNSYVLEQRIKRIVENRLKIIDK